MKTLTKADIETLANEIMEYLIENELDDGVCIYYNNKRIHNKYNWRNPEEPPRLITEDNMDPHDYFEYAAYNHILSMSFEGPLYDVLNYTFGRMEEKFSAIFEKWGLYYEFGNAWNLTTYLLDDNVDVEYTKYGQEKETIYLYHRNAMDNPSELQTIMDVWYKLSKSEGDKGSCVLGAGFGFEWRDNEYFMSACSPYQGSLSWEVHKDTIKALLEGVGATNIAYNWGRMD